MKFSKSRRFIYQFPYLKISSYSTGVEFRLLPVDAARQDEHAVISKGNLENAYFTIKCLFYNSMLIIRCAHQKTF